MARSDLDTRPEDKQDDELNPANRAMPTDESVDAGIDQLEAYANDPKNAVAAKEANASTNDGQDTSTSRNEQSIGRDSNDSHKDLNYTGDGERKSIKQRVIANRKKLGLGVGGVGVTLGFIGIFLSGPSFIMTHLSTLMTDKMGSLEASHQARYRRSKFAKFTDRFSIDGRRGSQVIKEMEARGYNFVFNPEEPNKIDAIRRPDGTYAPTSVGAVDDEISEFLDRRWSIFGQPTRSARWKSARMEAFYKRYGVVSRQSIVKRLPGDAEDAEVETNKRMFNATQGEDELDTRTRAPDGEDADNVDDATKAGREVQEQGLEEGDELFAEGREHFAEGGDKADAPGLAKHTDEIKTGYAPNALSTLEGANALTQGFGFVKGLLNVADPADKICAVKNKLSMAVTIARAFTSIQLMRASFAFISADDGQRKGEASADLVGALLARVTTSDAVMGNFANSTNYQFATTGKFSTSKNLLTRDRTAVDGKLTGLMGLIKDKVSWISGCAVWQNPFFQGAAAIGTVVISIFTFGSGGAALTAGSTLGKVALTEAFKATIRSMVTKRALVGIAAGVVIDISFEQILQLAQLYAQEKLSIGLTGQEEGAMLAAVLFAGAGVMHKQRALMGGQVPATAAQFAQANAVHLAEKKEELRNKSFTERIFAMDNYDSLAHQSMATLAFGTQDPVGAVRQVSSTLALTPLSVFGSVSDTLTASASAQDDDLAEFDTLEINGTEYATDPSGNLRTFMPSWLTEADEIANRDKLIADGQVSPNEPYEIVSGSDFEKHVENCVYSADTISPLENDDSNTDPTLDCTGKTQRAREFKIHLAYLDSNDFIDAYLFPEEISDVNPENPGGSGGSGGSGVGLGDLTGPIIPCQGEPKNESDFFGPGQNAINWDSIPPSGIIGQDSAGNDQGVYVRDACAGQSDIRTVVIGSSIHGSENGGQRITFELLYNADLPDDVRIVAIPEVNKSGIASSSRTNSNGVNLNRNFDYRWSEKGTSNPSDGNYYGPSAASEPETQNVQNFLTSVGQTSLFISYHDCINWVAPSGPNTNESRPIAQAYANLAPQESGSCNGSSNTWRMLYNNQGQGFMEGWYANATGSRALLVELTNSESASYMKAHANVVKQLLDDGVIN